MSRRGFSALSVFLYGKQLGRELNKPLKPYKPQLRKPYTKGLTLGQTSRDTGRLGARWGRLGVRSVANIGRGGVW